MASTIGKTEIYHGLDLVFVCHLVKVFRSLARLGSIYSTMLLRSIARPLQWTAAESVAELLVTEFLSESWQ